MKQLQNNSNIKSKYFLPWCTTDLFLNNQTCNKWVGSESELMSFPIYTSCNFQLSKAWIQKRMQNHNMKLLMTKAFSVCLNLFLKRLDPFLLMTSLLLDPVYHQNNVKIYLLLSSIVAFCLSYRHRLSNSLFYCHAMPFLPTLQYFLTPGLFI